MPTKTPPKLRYSFKQRESLWLQAGGSKQLAPLMAWISMHEDPSGDPKVINDNPSSGDYSVGLWQINYYGSLLKPRSDRYGAPQALANDPLAQAKAAVDLAQNGKGLSNWTTYPAALRDLYTIGPGGPGTSTSGPYDNPQVTVDKNGKIIATSNPSNFGGALGFLQSLNKPWQKYVLYGFAVFGGTLLILMALLLIGADLGIAVLGRNRITSGGKKLVGQFGSPEDPQMQAYKRGEISGKQSAARREGFKAGKASVASKEKIEGPQPVYSTRKVRTSTAKPSESIPF